MGEHWVHGYTDARTGVQGKQTSIPQKYIADSANPRGKKSLTIQWTMKNDSNHKFMKLQVDIFKLLDFFFNAHILHLQ